MTTQDQIYRDEQRFTGTVAWFDGKKGFGFLRREDGQPDVFVHFSAVRGQGYRKLLENARVEFSIAQGRRGLEARDVVTLDGPLGRAA
jgi:CspA family cold shock protein